MNLLYIHDLLTVLTTPLTLARLPFLSIRSRVSLVFALKCKSVLVYYNVKVNMEGKFWTIIWGCLAVLYALKADEGAGSRVTFEESKPADNISAEGEGRNRDGKNLFDFLGFTLDGNTDPYLLKANAACREGELSECFKSKALSSLDDFFQKQSYTLNDHARVVRMPVGQLRKLQSEPYEFTNEFRSESPEWDQFVAFVTRKVEKFVKSVAVEVKIPDEILEEGTYAPRFIDEITSEIDILEDKKASLFSRNKLKKLFIPLLIILKLFKLKLLLFLPLILGLASFKKLLGFLAIVIPGLIGFYKLCKPDLHHNYGNFAHSSYYHKPPHHSLLQGVAYREGQDYGTYNGHEQIHSPSSQYPIRNDAYEFENAGPSGSVSFRDQEDPHQLAYQGYKDYQNR